MNNLFYLISDLFIKSHELSTNSLEDPFIIYLTLYHFFRIINHSLTKSFDKIRVRRFVNFDKSHRTTKLYNLRSVHYLI